MAQVLAKRATPERSVRDLSGEAAASALLVISDWPDGYGTPSNAYDFGTRGVPRDHTFTVRNQGAMTANEMADAGGLSGDFGYKGGAYPGAGGTCGRVLGAGERCTLVVTFTPSGSGPRAATLGLSYVTVDGVGKQASRALSGTATTLAVLQVSPHMGGEGTYGTYDFGASGIPVERTFYLSNVGGNTATNVAPAALASDFAYKGGATPGEGGTCVATLDRGAQCTLVVVFTPSGEGPRSATLRVDYAGGETTQASLSLAGTAVSGAMLKISDWPGATGGEYGGYDYGTWGVWIDHTFTVRNLGTVPAERVRDAGSLGNGFAYKGGAYPGAGGTCAQVLNSGAECTVIVTFIPSGSGTRTSKLALDYGTEEPAKRTTRDLYATATDRARVVVREWEGQTWEGSSPLDFGTWGVPTSRLFTLANVGAQAASNLAAPALAAPFSYKTSAAFPGEGGDCTSALNSGATCRIAVTFTPQGDGARSGLLDIAYADTAGTLRALRELTGTATTAARLVIQDFTDDMGCGERCGAYDFGNVPVGSAHEHTFFLHNVGGAAATGLADTSGFHPPFSFKGGAYPGDPNGCTDALAAGALCTLVVTFAPTAATTSFATLSLDALSAATGLRATRSLRGSGIAP